MLSLLQVMEQKGLVGHRQRGKAYTYFAKADRDRTFQMLAGGFLDKVFDGAVDEYLVHALQSRRVSAEELDRLEKMIAEAKTRSKKENERRARHERVVAAFAESLAGWLADFYLLATLLLGLDFHRASAGSASRCIGLTAAWIVMIELAVLAVVCALPGWPRISLVAAAPRGGTRPAPESIG